MKKTQLKEYRAKSVAELRNDAQKLQATLSEVSVKIASSQEKNLKAKKNLRKDLAQILTVIKEKALKKEDK